MILTWMSTISAPDIVLVAVAAMFGLIIGWLIWGGRRRYIAQLEDDLSQARKQTRSILVANKRDHAERDDVESVMSPDKPNADKTRADKTPANKPGPSTSQSMSPPARQCRSNKNADLGEGVNPPAATPGSTQAATQAALAQTKPPVLDGSRDERLAALTDELTKIRALLGQSELNTDPVKESLDQADTSIKRANGRLRIIMSSPPFDKEPGGER